MPNREKVMKGLECCIPMTLRSGLADCENCPYDRKITIDGGITECCHVLMTDALALLKAQEPVKPTKIPCGLYYWYHCGACNAIIDINSLYCQMCGRKVKRDA